MAIELSDTAREEQEAFRRSLSAFIGNLLTPEVRAAHYDPKEIGGWSAAYRREFATILGREGFLGRAWPVEYGGEGKGLVYDAILFDEVEYHEAPVLEPSACYIPFTLLSYGSEWQKRTFLPQILNDGLSIFVGYSEPEAGSDLANLSTAARRSGGGWVLNGVKYFSTFAGTADYGLFAARSQPRNGPKHQGISLFLVPMTSPGIEINEHRMMTGEIHHAVYLKEVFVPDELLVGPADDGWPVLMAAINYERLVQAASGQGDFLVEHLRGHVLNSPEVGAADRLVSAAIESRAASLYYDSVVARAGTIEEDPGDGATVAQLLKRESVRVIETSTLQILGSAAGVTGGESAVDDGRFARRFIIDLVYEFAAGGLDITRQVIAKRVLGMGRARK